MTFNLKIGKTIYVKSEVYYLLNILKLSYVYINFSVSQEKKMVFTFKAKRCYTGDECCAEIVILNLIQWNLH